MAKKKKRKKKKKSPRIREVQVNGKTRLEAVGENRDADLAKSLGRLAYQMLENFRGRGGAVPDKTKGYSKKKRTEGKKQERNYDKD